MRRWGELGARDFPYLSILTSSWAPAKDKTIGVSAGSTMPSVRPSAVFSYPPAIPPLPLHSSLPHPFLQPSALLPNLLLCIPALSHLVYSPAQLPPTLRPTVVSTQETTECLLPSREGEEILLHAWGEVRCSCSARAAVRAHSCPDAPTTHLWHPPGALKDTSRHLAAPAFG